MTTTPEPGLRDGHEAHRRALANALFAPEDADWPSLIRRAEQAWEGRHTWHQKAQEIEADRDRLAALIDQETQ